MKYPEADLIEQHVTESAEAVRSVKALSSEIVQCVDLFEACHKNGGTIYAFGNGGSACEAMHLVEELVARYFMERPGIRSQHFLDPSTMTCWGNDYDFLDVFKRQAEVFLTDRDVVVAFSTSGNSENILRGIAAAKEKGSKVVLLGGKEGGKAKAYADLSILIPSTSPTSARIQEAHILIVHLLVHLLENRLFPDKANS
jgi:D-sedoheptulose 7-phosphate isomerase